MRSYREDLPAMAMLGVTGVALLAVHFLIAPAGGVYVARAGDGNGVPEIRTGGAAYPRTAIDSDNFEIRVARPARRIASQYWSIDEYVYSVAEPSRVVAVSESAFERRMSNVYRHAERFRPVVATDPERVLRQLPDLMLVANSSRADFCDLVRSTGVPIYRAFVTFTSLEQVAETIRLTGYLTGEDERARAETQRFWAEIGQARSRRPANARSPRILGLGGKYSYGDQTLFHDIVRTVGGTNVGAEGGLRGYDAVSSEQILRWNPEWIVSGADPGASQQVLARLLADPAIAATQAAKDGHILVLEHRVFLPMSPFSSAFVRVLAEALYG